MVAPMSATKAALTGCSHVNNLHLPLFSCACISWPLKTDVEKVLGQIRQGNVQAATVIRGQHEQLTGAIDREKRTKRELVSKFHMTYFKCVYVVFVLSLHLFWTSVYTFR